MFSAYEKIYVLTPSKTAIDKLIAKFYNKLSKNVIVKLDVDCAKDCDVFVGGDFVVQIFFDEEIKKALHQSYLKAKVVNALGLSKIYETVLNSKTEINMIILKS